MSAFEVGLVSIESDSGAVYSSLNNKKTTIHKHFCPSPREKKAGLTFRLYRS